MSAGKTDFRSVEGQQRLMAALIAAQDIKKFEFKIMAKLTGTTESAMEHRFRTVRLQAEFLNFAEEYHRKGGLEPFYWPVSNIKSKQDFERAKECAAMAVKLSSAQRNVVSRKDPGSMSKDEIQMYFGASTEQGIQFQSRFWRANAEVLRNAVENGQDPVKAFSDHIAGNGSQTATPKNAKRKQPAKQTPSTAASTPANKRRRVKKETPITNDEEDSEDANYSELDRSAEDRALGIDTTPRNFKTKVKPEPEPELPIESESPTPSRFANPPAAGSNPTFTLPAIPGSASKKSSVNNTTFASAIGGLSSLGSARPKGKAAPAHDIFGTGGSSYRPHTDTHYATHDYSDEMSFDNGDDFEAGAI
ncbi:hypothetical protein QBC35DRAFT_448253 [Podospora australis]|uniref:Uncharacterized protein n=1 Tax=Podospora australis TaxID=1536484 RepID=A0AAN7ANB5_9PEZI|nr:hypothetical protein QBC35DRAFT_448253 [Podospora australis]